MLIPNVRVDFMGTNKSGGSRLVPAYVVPLIKTLWGPRLDPGAEGCVVTPVPLSAPDRYREVGSIALEEALWKAEFPTQYAMLYPTGLRDEITKLLKADAVERKAAADRAVNPTQPHESFIAAGCDAKQALSLQTAGYATLANIPDDFTALAEVPGIPPDLALYLIDKKAEDAAADLARITALNEATEAAKTKRTRRAAATAEQAPEPEPATAE